MHQFCPLRYESNSLDSLVLFNQTLVSYTMGSSDSTSTVSATSEEIEEWNAEHDEPHPVFQVEHCPERNYLSKEENSELVGQTRLDDFSED